MFSVVFSLLKDVSLKVEFRDFFRDNLGKVMIAVSILLLILGILMLGTSYFSIAETAFIPVISSFLGVLLLVCGLFVHVGLFSGRWRSVDGVFTVLLCISVGFFALAISAIQVQLVTGFEEMTIPCRSGTGAALARTFALYFPISVRPYLFLFSLGLQWGIVFLSASLILKVFNCLRNLS